MLDSILQIQPPFNMIVMIVLIATLGSTICTIAKQVRIYMVFREELNFKQEMASQGLSASEIERLLATKHVTTRAAE